MKPALIALTFALALPVAAHAQAPAPSPAAQALSTCVVNAATADDNVTLMRWMFAAMSRHPGVANLAQMSDLQRDQANHQMAALVNRLLLDACPDETRAAFRSDGAGALDQPFSALGEHAVDGLMKDPSVSTSIAEFANQVDAQRLAALIRQ